MPSAVLAAALGTAPSSITRLADRLLMAGYAARGTDQYSRNIVTLEATTAGRNLVTAVLDRRHALLEEVLDDMDPAGREHARISAENFARLTGDAAQAATAGPVPL